jgi:3-oxoacyl-[acyl-carrier-protein] synthase III
MVPFRSDVILKNALQNVGQLIENDLFNEEKSNDIQMELVHKAKETFSQLHQDYFKKTNQLTATKRVSISHNYAKQGATSVLILEAVDEQSRIEEERKKKKKLKKLN